MRFRFLTMADLPDLERLYLEYLEQRGPDELPYPIHDDTSGAEFTLAVARQLLGNPAFWYCIVGVMGSTVTQDANGEKVVVGGRPKGFIMVNMSERPIGHPKKVAFIELLVVDRKFQQKDVGRKLAHLAWVECLKRGAQVLEAAYSPNSLGEKLWPQYGAVPYRILAAYVGPDGQPKTEMPMPSKPKVKDGKEQQPG